jgi:ribosome-associated translation inhibitor RaiA
MYTTWTQVLADMEADRAAIASGELITTSWLAFEEALAEMDAQIARVKDKIEAGEPLYSEVCE